MLSTMRDAFGTVRQAIGARNTLLLVVVFLLAAPFILVFIVLGFLFSLLERGGSWASDALRGVGKCLNDPLFGPITYQGHSIWHAERELDALGGRFIIEIPGSGTTGPSQGCHELLRRLVEHQHEIGRQVQESLFREYQAVAPSLRQEFVVGSDWLSEEFRKSLPVLEKPDQIWGLLSDGFIALEDKPGCFSITWECTWDSEYAVTKTLVNWKLKEDEDG
jgi:hypothetical protein